MRCPTCKRPVPDEERRFLPFCSERCKLIDLGKWLDGEYSIPGEPAPEEEVAEELRRRSRKRPQDN